MLTAAASPTHIAGAANATSTTAGNPIDSASDWARAGVISALTKGFVPADIQNNYTNVITRAEFCRMAISWLEYVEGKNIDAVLSEKGLSRNENAFSDTNDPAILAAYALGITNGVAAPSDTAPGVFDPNGQFNREQAAVMVMNTCRAYGANIENPPTSDFTDLNTASSWAVHGINFVRANGIMSGTVATPPAFSPKSTYTKEQSIITLDNIKHNELPKMSTPKQTYSTGEYARLGFIIDSSWDNELLSDGRMAYYPSTDEPTGLIQCSFLELSIGKTSEQEAKTVLNNGFDGVKEILNSPVEKSLTYYKVGSNYAARACFYSDITNSDINDDNQMVIDAVAVLFDDGLALVLAIFTPAEYENVYKDAINATLSSIIVNVPEVSTSTPVPSPTPAPTPPPVPTAPSTPRDEHYTVRYGPRGGAICWCGKYMSQH